MLMAEDASSHKACVLKKFSSTLWHGGASMVIGQATILRIVRAFVPVEAEEYRGGQVWYRRLTALRPTLNYREIIPYFIIGAS